MNTNILPSDRFSLLTAVDPVSQAASTVVSTYVKCPASLIALIALGAIASTGTFNAKLVQATDSSGTGSKDITGKALTAVADTGDNKQHFINLFDWELDINNGFTHVALSMTTATAASIVFAALFAMEQRYAQGAHAASVGQVV